MADTTNEKPPSHIVNIANAEQGPLTTAPEGLDNKYPQSDDGGIEIGSREDVEQENESEEFDPFVPFPVDPNQPEEERILTFRAVFIGCVLGSLVNASNLYLGLRTGWGFGANMFGAIFGFAFLKFCSKTFSRNFPIFGGEFGPKENTIVQTTATAAGGLSGIFVSAIPAMYQMKLLSSNPVDDFGRLLTFTFVTAYYGLCFATPLRKFFLIHVARELKLIFPTPTATALTIRSMHMAGNKGTIEARKRTKALAISFSTSLLWRVMSQYAPGILWDWHIFLWFYQWGGYNNLAINVENWGWMIEWTPAFMGTGLIIGLNPALSFFGGSVLAWGIIGPCLVHYGAAYGVAPMEGDPKWGKLVNFYSFNLKDPRHRPSPRYWLLWPGVFVMITTSFAELAAQYKLIWYGLKCAWRATSISLGTLVQKARRKGSLLETAISDEKADHDSTEDPGVEPDGQIPFMMWAIPLVVIIVATCVILKLQYGLDVGMSILSMVLGFVFAFLVIQCGGATDIVPVTTASKATQVVLGAVTSAQGYSTTVAQRLNLVGGAVAGGAANHSSDLVIDFRVGFLLRTPPKKQWIAQALGSSIAVFLAPGMFVLFAKAYPCVIDLEQAGTCPFAAPSVSAWRAVASAVTDPTLPIPRSSAIFSMIFGIVGILSVLFRHYILVGSREKYRVYVPNFLALGLAFVLPQTVYGTAMVMGSTIAYFWAKKWPASFHTYCYAIAAGGIAGEGLGGVVNAIFQVAGIAGGGKVGTAIGCPYGEMC